MSAISLFAAHHDPHRAPLSGVNRLYDFGDFIHKCDCTCNMIKGLYVPDLFPGHWHILEELVDGMRDVFECAQIHPLILAEPFGRHVSMIFNNFSILNSQ